MATIDLDGITLHYTDEGAGEPVVLIHGFPLSSELWTPQRAALADRYRVIALDLRGHGRSDLPDENITIGHYADDVVALMDALGIGQATVAGLSMGGYTTMAILRRHPDRVRAVMLLATKAPGDTEPGKQGRDEMIRLAREEGATAVAEKMLPKMLTERTRGEAPELTGFVRSMMAGTPVEGIVAALHALRERPDSTPTLQQTRLPALILVGDKDELTPPADAEAMHRALSGSRLEVIPDAAHLLNLEQPEQVNRLLLDFLDATVEH
jgi:3-oxoadipate enol-lactonase